LKLIARYENIFCIVSNFFISIAIILNTIWSSEDRIVDVKKIHIHNTMTLFTLVYEDFIIHLCYSSVKEMNIYYWRHWYFR